MPLPERSLTIVDVGHGNCAVLKDSDQVLVIDTGPGSSLLEFLRNESIDKIDSIFISHADQDHIEGLLALLSSRSVSVGSVRLNTDSIKRSNLWDDLLYELDKAKEIGEISFETSLTRGYSEKFNKGRINVNVLAPSAYLAGKGPGSKDREKRKISTNSISAVISVTSNNVPVALFPGDIDRIGIDDLIAHEKKHISPILVFPHHGGRAGQVSLDEFTKKICCFSKPSTVIFSIGRGRHKTPHPDIIRTILSELPDSRIVCTQLSQHCEMNISDTAPSHLNDTFSQGRENNQCCCGTIVIDLDNQESIFPGDEEHKKFLSVSVGSALCKLSD